MSQSELVVRQLELRYHAHNKTPTYVNTAGGHAEVASAYLLFELNCEELGRQFTFRFGAILLWQQTCIFSVGVVKAKIKETSNDIHQLQF